MFGVFRVGIVGYGRVCYLSLRLLGMRLSEVGFCRVQVVNIRVEVVRKMVEFFRVKVNMVGVGLSYVNASDLGYKVHLHVRFQRPI
jgi:hypothetical protein